MKKSWREAESKKKRVPPADRTFHLGHLSEVPVQLFREVLEAREVVGRKDSWDISAISEGGEDSRAE